jgi:REase_DpnII-MboI
MDLARLLKPWEEVREALRERIDEARNIVPRPIKTEDELKMALAREKEWREYNSELLYRSFSTSEYATTYELSQTRLGRVENHYFGIDVDFRVFAARLSTTVEGQVACLQSIVNRLDLIPDTPAAESAVNVTQGQAAIVRLAERFHRVVGQLRNRHNSRTTLDINDEYDVQDLFHALLTLFFDDIRPEEWTPSYAGGASRIDFLLREIETVVELKKTRSSLSTKDLGEQLLVDIAKYKSHPGCRNIFCVVYDPDDIIKNPRGVENDLNGQSTPEIAVRVLIVPKR